MQGLRLFTDVARYRSFSEAARVHGITQSAASQRVGQLERELGVLLLDRSVRPLALTEAGKVYLSGAEDVLQRFDRLRQHVSGMKDDPADTVRVAAIYSSGIEMMERVRQAFEAKEPRFRVDVRYSKPDEIHRLVVEGEVDLGLVSYPERFKRVEVIELREEVMAVVCSPEHPLSALEAVGPAELTPYGMVCFDMDLPVGRRIRAYLREHGGNPRVTHRFDNLDTLKRAVSVTDAFAILPKRTVLGEIASGALRLVTLVPTLTRPIGAIHRFRGKRGGELPPAVSAFAAYLVDAAGPEVDVVSGLAEADKLIGIESR